MTINHLPVFLILLLFSSILFISCDHESESTLPKVDSKSELIQILTFSELSRSQQKIYEELFSDLYYANLNGNESDTPIMEIGTDYMSSQQSAPTNFYGNTLKGRPISPDTARNFTTNFADHFRRDRSRADSIRIDTALAKSVLFTQEQIWKFLTNISVEQKIHKDTMGIRIYFGRDTVTNLANLVIRAAAGKTNMYDIPQGSYTHMVNYDFGDVCPPNCPLVNIQRHPNKNTGGYLDGYK